MISFDGFLDSYYAYDFNNPPHNARVYTTQPARHNEPNINLIHAGVNLKEDRYRGRFALQAGNSVENNTVYEANQDLGHIQESYLGYKIDEKTWVDAGIYLGNIGMESWISKNNFTYSRSLMLDYVPYYSTGIRVSHDTDEKNHFEFHLMQGWQNISETNSAKSIGFQWKVSKFTYNNFFGDERVIPGQENRFRTYHNFIYQDKFSDTLEYQTSADIGTQAQQQNDGVDAWFAAAFTLRKKLNEKEFMAWRIEHYADPHQSNVKTNSPNGFVVQSASMNFDHHFSHYVLWRTEVRGYHSRDKIYPHQSNTDGFAVTSLAVSF
jgi:hypothetical protein